MTPSEMAKQAVAALESGQRMTLVYPSGAKMPQKFPRGELLCETRNGLRAYSYDPLRVLAWLAASGLVRVEATCGKGE